MTTRQLHNQVHLSASEPVARLPLDSTISDTTAPSSPREGKRKKLSHHASSPNMTPKQRHASSPNMTPKQRKQSQGPKKRQSIVIEPPKMCLQDPSYEHYTASISETSSLHSSHSDSSYLDLEESALTRIHYIVQELINTEKVYMQDLQAIVTGYFDPMRNEPELFHPDSVRDIFINIVPIGDFHLDFLEKLDTHKEELDQLAHCFLTTESELGFSLYTDFCRNVPRSLDLIGDCSKDPPRAEFIERCRRDLGHFFPLSEFIHRPIQRILKYPLLLRDLQKYVGGTKYASGVEAALDKITGVAIHINKVKRVQELENNEIVGWPEDQPTLLEFGVLKLEQSFKVNGSDSRYIFLFDKLLLITKYKDDKYHYKAHLLPTDIKMKEGATTDLKFEIEKFKSQKKNNSKFTIQASDFETKATWVYEIKRSLLESQDGISQQAKDVLLKGIPSMDKANQFNDILHNSPYKSFIYLRGFEDPEELGPISPDINYSQSPEKMVPFQFPPPGPCTPPFSSPPLRDRDSVPEGPLLYDDSGIEDPAPRNHVDYSSLDVKAIKDRWKQQEMMAGTVPGRSFLHRMNTIQNPGTALNFPPPPPPPTAPPAQGESYHEEDPDPPAKGRRRREVGAPDQEVSVRSRRKGDHKKGDTPGQLGTVKPGLARGAHIQESKEDEHEEHHHDDHHDPHKKKKRRDRKDKTGQGVGSTSTAKPASGGSSSNTGQGTGGGGSTSPTKPCLARISHLQEARDPKPAPAYRDIRSLVEADAAHSQEQHGHHGYQEQEQRRREKKEDEQHIRTLVENDAAQSQAQHGHHSYQDSQMKSKRRDKKEAEKGEEEHDPHLKRRVQMAGHHKLGGKRETTHSQPQFHSRSQPRAKSLSGQHHATELRTTLAIVNLAKDSDNRDTERAARRARARHDHVQDSHTPSEGGPLFGGLDSHRRIISPKNNGSDHKPPKKGREVESGHHGYQDSAAPKRSTKRMTDKELDIDKELTKNLAIFSPHSSDSELGSGTELSTTDRIELIKRRAARLRRKAEARKTRTEGLTESIMGLYDQQQSIMGLYDQQQRGAALLSQEEVTVRLSGLSVCERTRAEDTATRGTGDTATRGGEEMDYQGSSLIRDTVPCPSPRTLTKHRAQRRAAQRGGKEESDSGSESSGNKPAVAHSRAKSDLSHPNTDLSLPKSDLSLPKSESSSAVRSRTLSGKGRTGSSVAMVTTTGSSANSTKPVSGAKVQSVTVKRATLHPSSSFNQEDNPFYNLAQGSNHDNPFYNLDSNHDNPFYNQDSNHDNPFYNQDSKTGLSGRHSEPVRGGSVAMVTSGSVTMVTTGSVTMVTDTGRPRGASLAADRKSAYLSAVQNNSTNTSKTETDPEVEELNTVRSSQLVARMKTQLLNTTPPSK